MSNSTTDGGQFASVSEAEARRQAYEWEAGYHEQQVDEGALEIAEMLERAAQRIRDRVTENYDPERVAEQTDQELSMIGGNRRLSDMWRAVVRVQRYSGLANTELARVQAEQS